MRDVAIQTLARHRVPELRDEAARAHVAVEEATRTLEQIERRIPLWDRAIFFDDTPDEKRVSELRVECESLLARAASARSALDEAMASAVHEVPALRLAELVERAIGEVIRDHAVGRLGPRENASTIALLEEIADFVTSTWVRDFDSEAIGVLGDDEKRARLAAEAPASIVSDEGLGWAPLDMKTLLAVAACELERLGFAQERTRLASQVGRRASELGPNAPAELTAEASRAALTAFETVHATIERSIQAFPPMRIHSMALAAIGVIDADLRCAELAIAPDSGIVGPRALGGRLLLIAALTELRASVDACFPGMTALVSGRGGARDKEDLAEAVARARGAGSSVFRTRASEVAEQDEGAALGGVERFLHARFEAVGLRADVRHLLSHATMIGILEHRADVTRKTSSWTDRLFGDTSSADALKSHDERASWYRGVIAGLQLQCLSKTSLVTRELPIFRLRDAIIEADAAVRGLAAGTGEVDPREALAVFGKERAYTAIATIHSELNTLRRTATGRWHSGNLDLVMALGEVRGAVDRVRIELESHTQQNQSHRVYYTAALRGRYEAEQTLARWTWYATRALGWMSTDADVLAWFLTQES